MRFLFYLHENTRDTRNTSSKYPGGSDSQSKNKLRRIIFGIRPTCILVIQSLSLIFSY